MVKINVCKIDYCEQDGVLKCKTNKGPVTIQLSALGEDGVILRNDGTIEIGGPRPTMDYFTNNPPKTDEVFINVTGWFSHFYNLIIEGDEDGIHVAVVSK